MSDLKSISSSNLVSLKDVVERHQEISRNPTNDGFTRFLKVEHMDRGQLRLSRWGHLEEEEIPPTFYNVFRRGHVLFPSRNPHLRRVVWPDFDGICGEKTFVLKARDGLRQELLPFIMQSDALVEHAVRMKVGSTNPHVRWRDLASFEFALPSLEKQRRIAGVLRQGAAYTDKLLLLQEAGVKALASAASQEFAEVCNDFPSARLAEICLKKPQSGIYKSEQYRGRGAPMVNMGELFGNDIIGSSIEMQRIELDETELERYRLTSNDLLFGRRSVVLEGAGRCVLVGAHSEPIVFESSVLRATLDPEKVDNRFVFEWLRSPFGHQQIRRIVTFTTVSGVAGSDVARLPIPLPPLEIQKRIANKLSGLREKVGIAAERIEASRTLARAISRRVLEAS